MKLWRELSSFWKGFIIGGVTVPLIIVAIEIVVKLVVSGEIIWN